MVARSHGITALSFLMTASGTIVTSCIGSLLMKNAEIWSRPTIELATIACLLGGASIIIGVGLFKLRPWSRQAALALFVSLGMVAIVLIIVGVRMVRRKTQVYEGIPMGWWETFRVADGWFLAGLTFVLLFLSFYLNQQHVRAQFMRKR